MPKKKSTDNRVVIKNAIKTLAANIRFSSVDNPIQTIAIVSSIPSEGKTTIAAQLGDALSDGGKDVLIIECDMRRRSLVNVLHAHSRHGLYAVLSGRHTIDESVACVSDHYYFLDAEPGIPNPADILQSSHFQTMLQNLKSRFAYIILDTPPVSAFVDSVIVASQADATILVVRQDYVHREDVRDSFMQLQQAGANVIGTVLNCADIEESSKYYDYYHEKKQDAPQPLYGGSTVQAAAQVTESDQFDDGIAMPARRVQAPIIEAEDIDGMPRRRTQKPAGEADTGSAVKPLPKLHRSAPKTSAHAASTDEPTEFPAHAGYIPRKYGHR